MGKPKKSGKASGPNTQKIARTDANRARRKVRHEKRIAKDAARVASMNTQRGTARQQQRTREREAKVLASQSDQPIENGSVPE